MRDPFPYASPQVPMAQQSEALNEALAAMQLDPSLGSGPASPSANPIQGPRPAPTPTAPHTSSPPQAGLGVPPPLVEEEGLVIVGGENEPEIPYGPPNLREWEAQEPELELKYMFPDIVTESLYAFLICENCGGMWFRIAKEGMDRMWELKVEREQKQYRFEHECLHCGGKEKSYHRVGGRREYYGWHILGGEAVYVYAGPRPDVHPGWTHTFGGHSLRWFNGPYKFWFQVECFVCRQYREPPEHEKYLQEIKWQKALWEEGHGFIFPEVKSEEEESLEASMEKEGVNVRESSSEDSQ